MMKRLILPFLSFLVVLLAIPQKADAVNIGPFNVTNAFCKKIDQVGAILNSFTVVQWPTSGYPGITMGMLSQSSVIMEFCTYINQLEQLDTTNAIFYSANYLNTLTGKKWDDHLQQADRTFNLANSIYDFENGQQRKGALESRGTYSQMNDFIRDTYKWGNQTFNSRDAELQTRGQREMEMSRFAGVAYQRAILKDMMNCPDPADGKDYSKIYDKTIRPQEIKRQEAEEEYLFFKEKLMSMGPRFLDSQNDMQQFINLLENLEVAGVTYDVKEVKIKENTTKPSATKKGSDNKPAQEKVQITRTAQTFSVRIFDELFSEFKNKYSDRWKGWVTAKIVAEGTFGLLDNPTARVEAEFRDLNFECSPQKLMRGYDDTQGSYDRDLKERKENCEQTVNMNQKKAENLFNYYTTELQNALFRMKSANALIWTTESREMGRTRVITKNTEGGFQQEQIKCAQSLTPAEMDKLGLKQQAVNNELNEMLVMEMKKQTIMQEQEMKQQAEANKEQAIRREMMERRRKEQEKSDSIETGIVPNRGGLGQ